MTLTAEQKAEVFARLDATEGRVLGLAVSGGGDSMALMALAREWARGHARQLAAVTVDHGLRPEAAEEARRVASYCAEIGIPHDTLVWRGWDGTGNLQDAARRARLSLIGNWAKDCSISAVATGHTSDDQAETVLLRLARGSGVDGLSAMADSRHANGITWHRPLLNAPRAELRDFLAAQGLPWIDDPSNEDTDFARVRERQAMAVLEDLGITRDGLVATAARMRRARLALETATNTLGSRTVRIDRGDLLVDWPGVVSAPEEIRNRLVARCLMWVSGADYRPRATALESAISAMAEARTTVLSGCHVSANGTQRRITREFAAVRGSEAAPGNLWDGRWRVAGPARGVIRALGEGIRDCPDWRDSGLPRTSLLASPAIWQDERLIAAPLAGFGRGWTAQIDRPDPFVEPQ